MIVHDFTVKICRQTLNTKASAKDTPYFYKAEEPDFKELTTDQLNHLYEQALKIETRIQTMLEQRQ
jgi:hypothetical protein